MTSFSLKAFALGAALGLVLAVAPSCGGGGGVACDPSTCAAGCCSNNVCLAGTAINGCGKGGLACNTCSSGQSCTNGSCGSTFTGGGQGGGGGTGGGTGGGAGNCSPSNCADGCCKNGSCAPGTAADSCGTAGIMCVACGVGSGCNNKMCSAVVPPVDSGVVDSGTNVVDSGMMTVDSGMMTVDSGMMTVDSGTMTVDSGTPGDAGMVVTCNPSVVISQVYGGGGGQTATFRTDYVELHNRTAAPVDVSTWSLQYASATSDGGVGEWKVALLTGSVAANGFFLVGLGSGSDGGTLTATPDFSPLNALTMSATDGKIALVNTVVPLIGCPAGQTVVDFVGYGFASCFEGTAAGTLSKTEALFRQDNAAAPFACTDTNNNSSDFVKGNPAPRNSASAPSTCVCTQ